MQHLKNGFTRSSPVQLVLLLASLHLQEQPIILKLITAFFKSLSPAQQNDFSEICTLLKLIIVTPATNAEWKKCISSTSYKNIPSFNYVPSTIEPPTSSSYTQGQNWWTTGMSLASSDWYIILQLICYVLLLVVYSQLIEVHTLSGLYTFLHYQSIVFSVSISNLYCMNFRSEVRSTSIVS